MKKVKAVQHLFLMGFMAMVFVSVSSGSYAFGQDKALQKIRKQVEDAAPDDWETLADAAEKCIRKDINMKQALEWLNRSIEIKENTRNLEIKGDYYLKNKLPKKALAFYLASKKKGLELDQDFDYYHLEEKISEASALRNSLG